MATILSRFAKRQLPSISAAGAGTVIVNDYFIDLATTDLLAANIVDIGDLPAYHTVSDAVLIADDLDTGAAITLDVGIMSGTPGDAVSVRTSGAEIFSASTIAQAGGAVRASLASAFKIQSSGANRSIGVKVLAAPAGAVAGRVRLRVFMHVSDQTLAF